MYMYIYIYIYMQETVGPHLLGFFPGEDRPVGARRLDFALLVLFLCCYLLFCCWLLLLLPWGGQAGRAKRLHAGARRSENEVENAVGNSSANLVEK